MTFSGDFHLSTSFPGSIPKSATISLSFSKESSKSGDRRTVSPSRQAGALLVSTEQFFDASQRDQIVALAARNRIPTMFGRREAAAAGGLISYGTDFADAYRQVGVLTGRILKGEKLAISRCNRPPKSSWSLT